MSKGAAQKSEVLQGTLDLMILKTLHALGPQHGFGLARRIEQVSEDVLQLNEGTVYTSLLRLQQKRLDHRAVGRVGEQPQGQVLFHQQARARSTRARDRGVAPHLRRHRPHSAARGQVTR